MELFIHSQEMNLFIAIIEMRYFLQEYFYGKNFKKIQSDTKGRIALGKYSKNVDLFSMEINEEGQIILTPHT